MCRVNIFVNFVNSMRRGNPGNKAFREILKNTVQQYNSFFRNMQLKEKEWQRGVKMRNYIITTKESAKI